jgi:hypothetical protein
MSQLMDEILRKVSQLPANERRQLANMLAMTGYATFAYQELDSKTDSLEHEATTRAAQAELARSIRGKYAHVSTSSDRFNRRKHAETELENRRMSPPTRRKR